MKNCFLSILLTFTFSTYLIAQDCFQIKSVLADACGTPEGENEMVTITTENSNLDVSDLVIDWPNNSYKGICQNSNTANKVAQMNGTITSCGYFKEPPGGIIPPNSKVYIVGSEDFNAASHDFSELRDTIYVIFQCSGNTQGHFANYNSCGTRTVDITFGGGCSKSLTYDRCLLTNQSGGTGGSSSARDGGRAELDENGMVVYRNYGCTPLDNYVFSIDTVLVDGTPSINYCPGDLLTINLNIEGYSSVDWYGNKNAFGHLTGTGKTNTYQTEINDTIPFYIFAKPSVECSNASDLDSILVSPFSKSIKNLNPKTSNICTGGTVNLTASGGTGANAYLWSTGSTTAQISVNQSGIYSVTISDGCYSENFSSTVNISPIIVELGNDDAICTGESKTLQAPAGYKYTWTPNGETTGSLQVTSPGIYGVIVSDSSDNCSASDSVTISLTPVPIFGTQGSLDQCVGENINFSFTLSEVDYDFSWDNVPGNTTNNLIITNAQLSDAGNYVFHANDKNSTCEFDTTISVIISSPPIVAIGNPPVTCEGESTRIGTNISNAFSYLWNDGSTSDSLVISTTGKYWVDVIETANGCSSSDTLDFVLATIPSPILPNDTTICPGSNLTLSVATGYMYVWTPTSETSSSITINSEGTYSVQATDSSGTCANSDDIEITLEQTPVFNSTGETNLCEGSTLSLTTVLSTNDYNLSWLPSNQQGNNLNITNIQTTDAGNFILTATNTQSNCTFDTTISVVVSAPPFLEIGSPPLTCEGNSVKIGTNISNAFSYLWSTGSTQDSIIITNSGEYLVEIKEKANSCLTQSSINFTFTPYPIVSLPEDSQICEGSNITLAYDNSYLYQWAPNGEQTASILISAAGEYSVIVQDATGSCEIYDTIIITTSPAPIFDLQGNFDYCEQDQLQISTALSYSDYTLTWNPSIQTDSILNINNVSSTNQGLHTLTANSIAGSCTFDTSFTVTVNTPPNMTIVGATEACKDDVVTLATSFANASSYLWSDGSIQPTLNVTEDGTYSVTAYDLNSSCPSTASTQITFVNPPTVSLPEDFTLCTGLTQGISATIGSTATHFEWTPSFLGTSLNANISDSGTYILRAYQGNSCFNADTIVVSAAQFPSSSVVSDTTVCFEDIDSLQVYLGFAQKYYWNSDTADSIVYVKEPGTYDIALVGENGCIIYDIITINNSCISNLWIPNAFTPNGDMKNDHFQAKGHAILSFSMFIFDRWGQEIWNTNDLMDSWNGLYKGKEAPLGLYVYLAEYEVEGVNGYVQKKLKKGTISLIR